VYIIFRLFTINIHYSNWFI